MNKKMYIYAFALILLISILILVGNYLAVEQNNDLNTLTSSFFDTVVSPPIETQMPTKDATPPPTQPKLSLENLISTNGNCNLPCFWGIEPGITKWADAMTLFDQTGVKGVLGTSSNNNEYFTAIVDVEEVSLLMDVYRIDDFVGAILVTIANKPPLTGFRPDFQNYSLKEIFLDLGAPVNILFAFDFPPETPTQKRGYSFWINYEDDGLQVDYVGAVEQSSVSEVCPEQTLEQMVLYLYSPSLKFLPWGWNILRDAVKLEDISSTSTMDFYQLTIQSSGPVCIEIEQ